MCWIDILQKMNQLIIPLDHDLAPMICSMLFQIGSHVINEERQSRLCAAADPNT